MRGNHSLLWEQHRFLDTIFGTIWQGIIPYSWEQHRCMDNVFGIIRQGFTPNSCEPHRYLNNVFGTIWQGITLYFWEQHRCHSQLKEQHRFLDTMFGTIWQGIIPYPLEQHWCLDKVFQIIYDRESLPTLGTTQVSGSCIWDYLTGNHSLLWEQHKCLNNVYGKIWQGITPYSWEQHRCLNNVFGTIWQGITPYSGNNTGVLIVYLGLYDRESLSTLGTTQIYGYSIWDYMPRNHSLLWEQHRCLDNVFGIIWQGITP